MFVVDSKRILAALVLSACCVSAAAEPAIDGLSRKNWANRLAGGPIKTVFLAPYGAQHDSFELMQRFDIDGRVLTMSAHAIRGHNEWGFGVLGYAWPDLLPTNDEVVANMRRALLAEWEAVVMSNMPAWSRYPQDVRQSILEKVAAGRGLIIGGEYIKGELQKDVEAMGLSLEKTDLGAGRFEFRNGEWAQSWQGWVVPYRVGKGRVIEIFAVNLPARGYILVASPQQSDFEFSAARAGWLLQRAARPDVRHYVNGTSVADGSLVVELTEGAAAPGTTVHVAVHRRDTYEKYLDTTAQPEPGKPVTIALPQLPQLPSVRSLPEVPQGGRFGKYPPVGEYHAEVRITDGEGVTLDWDAIRFSVKGPVKFRELTVDRNEIEHGDTLNCHLDVEGQTEGLEMIAQWYDNWDRLLVQTAPRPFAEELAITAPAGSLSVLNRLEVTLFSQRGPEAVAGAELLMPQNVRPTDFYMLYWKAADRIVDWEKSPDSWRLRLQWDVLRRHGGADAWANGLPNMGQVRDAALNHLRSMPRTTSFHSMTLDKELFNDGRLASAEKSARKTARNFRPYSPMGYTIGSENYVSFNPEGRFADTPVVWAKFQNYLRDVYPDLHALNAQWETNFAAWDDIRFESEKQMLPSMDNPSPWFDYRMFVTRHFTDAHQRMGRAIRDEHPGALVGWDAMEQFSSYSGIDWWELTRNMGSLNVYHLHLVADEGHPWGLFTGESVGSFGHDAALRGCWLNEINREHGGVYVPWYLLLNGRNSAWWWQATFLHPANGPLRWDLGLTPMAESVAGAVKQIKHGPGTLLAHARKDVSPIAVHYSASNFHASTIESGVANHVGNLGIGVAFWMAPTVAARAYKDEEMERIWGGVSPKGHYAVASANVYTLLHDIGFEPRTMARQEIEADALTESDTRVLILPFVVSLSDLEVAKIREFMMGGGVLIADYRCGLRDEHGRVRETPALDDVFGIKRESLEVRRGRGTLVADVAGGVRFESVFHDPVVADGAETRAYHDDGTPALFRHHYSGGSTDSFGWYRRHVRTPAEFAGKNLYLVFEAVDEDTHLYINGTKAFEHSCESAGLVPNDIWETPFYCDVSDFLRPGEEDQLAVGVYNSAGMGGIYKPVYLVAADAGMDLAALQERVRDGSDVLPLPAWRFALDVAKRGMEEKWYATDFDDAAWAPMRTDLHTGWQGQGFSGGEAVYLNTDLYGYIDLRRSGRERRMREFFAELLVQIDHLYPPFQIKRRYGFAAGRIEMTRHVDGDTWYYGVLPAFDVDDLAPREVILPFPDQMHVYDVRAQKYLGPGGPIEQTVHPGRPQMYAVLPYAVEDLSILAPMAAERGEPVDIRIIVAAPTHDIGPHAVRVEVNLPDGRQVEYLGRTLYLPQGEGVFSFVPALNSPAGRWSVSATEAVSGKRATTHFEVR